MTEGKEVDDDIGKTDGFLIKLKEIRVSTHGKENKAREWVKIRHFKQREG